MTLVTSGRYERGKNSLPTEEHRHLKAQYPSLTGVLYTDYKHVLSLNKSFGPAPAPLELVTIEVGLRDTLTLTTDHRSPTAEHERKVDTALSLCLRTPTPSILILPSPPLNTYATKSNPLL